MARKFEELRKAMSPGRRRRNASMTLADLRRSVGLSQVDIATRLGVTQGYVSKLERRGDTLVSSLRGYVEALGGEVEVRVRLGGLDVVVVGNA